MKRILMAIALATAFCSLALSQKTTIVNDTADKAQTVITQDETNMEIELSDSVYTATYQDIPDTDSSSHSHESFMNLPDSGDMVAITSIIVGCSIPILIVFFVVYFNHKNQQIKYKAVEKSLELGQPLPESFFRNNYRSTELRSKGIKTTCTGFGLFIFLWAITESFGVGSIGLIIMFTGIGEYLSGQITRNKPDSSSQTYKKDEPTNEA